MNYTIIGHTEDASYFGRKGDYVDRPGAFETWYFRDSDKENFLEVWADARYHNRFEHLYILLNGIATAHCTDDELQLYDELELEMLEVLKQVKAKAEEELRIKQEALQRKRDLEAQKERDRQRQLDLQTFNELKRKLGIV